MGDRPSGDPVELMGWLEGRLESLRATTADDPFANAVLLLAVELDERWATGATDAEAVDAVIRRLTLDASLHRAKRLGPYLGELGEAANAARQEELFQALPTEWEAFRAAVERPRYGFVFTAHPTFAHDVDVQADLLALALDCDRAGLPLDEGARAHLVERLATHDHRMRQPVTLDVEHRLSLHAIDQLRAALENAHRRVMTVARERFPDHWRALRPQLVTVATWVGYDLDGRSDIPWRKTCAKRLEVQARQLEVVLDRTRALLEKARPEPTVVSPLELLEARTALALRTVQEGVGVMTTADDAAALARLAQWSRDVLRPDPMRLNSAAPLLQIVERALERTTSDELALDLAVLAADLRGMGLARAQTHLRINAVQLHNAIRKQLGMDHPPDDPSYRLTYLDAVCELIEREAPVSIHFGSVDGERTTARRVFMLMAQLLKVVDADEPLRFLIAETDSAFTVLTALHFAKLFGIDDKIDISPLFETEKALERGVEVVREALDRRPFQDYVRRRGRLCLQMGYSDAGRFLGQTAAAVKIERLKLDLAALLRAQGLNGVEVVLFDTHGESIGRGAHPESFADRLDYLDTPEVRRRFRASGVRVKEETSYQGGDGYLPFLHPISANAVLTRVLEHVLVEPGDDVDPFYGDDVFAAEFFTVVKRYADRLVDDPDYAALLGAYGANLLDPTGSRALKRQHDGGGPQNLEHPSQLRAIPNNAVLQQLGYLANSLGGAGLAVAKDPERFRQLYADSDRFRRLVGMIEHAFKYSDPTVLRAYIDILDPGLWLMRAAEADDDGQQACTRAVADALERGGFHERLVRVFRVLLRDQVELAHGLRQHRRSQRAQGMAPIVVSAATRDTMHLSNAVRLACVLRLFSMAVQVPEFADRNDTTHEEIVALLLHLDVDAAVGTLKGIFPYSQSSGPALDWGEAATYEDADAQSYRQEHEQIFDPLLALGDRIRRISSALVHQLGAVG